MGTPGVTSSITKSQIVKCIKNRKGVGARICEDLNVCYQTFYKLIEKYDLKDELQRERNAFAETMCDVAESVLMRGMVQTQELGNALSAAKYVLNNKGRNRGYYPPVAPPVDKETIFDDLTTGLKQIPDDTRSKKAGKSEMAPQQPVSDR